MRTTWFDPEEGETWEVQLRNEWAFAGRDSDAATPPRGRRVIVFTGGAGTFSAVCDDSITSVSSLSALELARLLKRARASGRP